jgi:MYXO-CTERM domain-containing protein
MARRRWLHCVLTCTSLFPSFALAQVVTDPDAPPVVTDVTDVAEVDPRVEHAFESEERVGVFFMLRESEASVASAQDAVIDALGADFEVWYRYGSIRAMAGELTRDGLSRARALAQIKLIQIDGTGSGGLAEALPAVGVDKVQSVRGLSGKGVTVAVLDSGAPTMHPALQGAIVGQHCFTSNACPPSNARESDSAEDDHNHGSNVTGIVASRGGGGVAKGYAPGANIVAVKVLNRQNAGRVSDWVAGFDWVATNLSTLKVQVINASLVSTMEYANAADCDRGEAAMAAVTKKLIDAGVTITASSGNTGHTATMTAPACNTGVIAVGATYDSDLGQQPESGGTYQALGGGSWPACSDAATNSKTIACFTSTAMTRLDVLAPGSQITSAGKGTGRSMFRGTSQAAPGVAGLSALLLECNPRLKPSMILDVLKATGEPVMDPRSGLMYPLIRGMQAAEMACPMGGPGATGTAGATAPGTAGAVSQGAAGAAPVAGAPAAGSGGSSPVSGAAGSSTLVPGTPGITVPSTTTPSGSLAGQAPPSPVAGTGGGMLVTAGTGVPLQVPGVEKKSGCQVSNAGTSGGSAGFVLFALASLVFKARRRPRVRTR